MGLSYFLTNSVVSCKTNKFSSACELRIENNVSRVCCICGLRGRQLIIGTLRGVGGRGVRGLYFLK